MWCRKLSEVSIIPWAYRSGGATGLWPDHCLMRFDVTKGPNETTQQTTTERVVARHRQLARAPIREALIDIQFEPPLPIELIDRFVSSVESSFSKKTDIWEAQFGLILGNPSPTPHSMQKAIGRRLDSADGLYVLQCRSTGFTLSRLTPYGKWSDLRDEAFRLWSALARAVDSLTVTRIAVRYINQIAIPVPFGDFNEYLTCPPQLPDDVPQALSEFLVRVVIPDPSTRCVSIVTQALEGQPVETSTGASIAVLLDIDVFREGRLESAEMEQIWEGVDELRAQKNRLFFAHITEKAVELYA